MVMVEREEEVLAEKVDVAMLGLENTTRALQ